ncbi:substrate-binding domain-containing protein [Variovorax dokdonensis]|uniref:Substrate-binding domain-containing protein n=1 Tax=Variovorax dokdonensis TaxID=344883 RepID=A0ABT7NA86_9BURK|nr:substrate-binding domain-containing protein [Variovorax dokdonensis]MDM0044839.1 substrate-binding domain-containing protein [Variovorax dokdonensis]
MSSPRPGIHLRYTFESGQPHGQHGAQIENPLFDLLSQLQAHGSISAAARAQGMSYRHAWGSLKHWEEVLGSPLVLWSQGKHARLTPFAQRLLWAERQARVRMTPHVEALRAELARAFALAADAALEVLEIFASHDLGLPKLQTLAEERDGLHIGLRFAGSQEALRALNAGRCRVAGFHVAQQADSDSMMARVLRPLLQPGKHKLIGSHWRRQGWIWRKGDARPDSVEALRTGRWRFVSRQPESGTRLLTDHLLAQAGLRADEVPGYTTCIEDTHVAVAAAIAAGTADVGIGIEAAAAEAGLAFSPLVDENYYLLCLKEDLETPSIRTLRERLASPDWAEALAPLPGYGVRQPGEVLSLTEALPWWHYARPKRDPAKPARSRA